MSFIRYLCWETVWLEEQVVMTFQIDSGHGQGGIREFVYVADRPAFLKRELVGLGVDEFQ